MPGKKCPLMGMRDCKSNCAWFCQAAPGCAVLTLSESAGVIRDMARMDFEKRKAAPAGKQKTAEPARAEQTLIPDDEQRSLSDQE